MTIKSIQEADTEIAKKILAAQLRNSERPFYRGTNPKPGIQKEAEKPAAQNNNPRTLGCRR